MGSIYKANIDFEKLNGLTNKLIEGFYRDIVLNKKADVRHRFLGAATPKGAVDFIPNITEGIQKRYFLKGRPGSGKSTMLKKIAKAAEQRGFDVEVYHCGFDPHSLDMVIVREVGLPSLTAPPLMNISRVVKGTKSLIYIKRPYCQEQMKSMRIN